MHILLLTSSWLLEHTFQTCMRRPPARAQHPTEDQQCFSAQKISLSYGLQADADWSQVTSTMAGDAQQRIALTVLPNQFLIKTVQEFGRMPFTEFTSFYSVRQHTLLTWLHSATVHTEPSFGHHASHCFPWTHTPKSAWASNKIHRQIFCPAQHVSHVVCAGVRPEDQPVPCTDVPDRRVNPNNGSSPHLGQGAVMHEGGTGNGQLEELCCLHQLQAGWTHWCRQGTASQLLLPELVGK